MTGRQLTLAGGGRDKHHDGHDTREMVTSGKHYGDGRPHGEIVTWCSDCNDVVARRPITAREAVG